VSVILQIIHYEAYVTPISPIGWIGGRYEMQFHFSLPGSEPDEMEMRQGLWRLFFLQA
jgi:hypothetical protein